MGTINADNILTRIREVLFENRGTARKIAATRYYGGAPEGLADEEASLRAAERPIVDVRLGAIERGEHTYPVVGSLAILDVQVAVIVTRHLDLDHKLTDATRDDVLALVAEDADLIRQALTWPGNLTQTESAGATGLATGLLEYVGSTAPDVQAVEPGCYVRTQHNFLGRVTVSQ